MTNRTTLFLACFLTLAAAGVGFMVRNGGVLGEWGVASWALTPPCRLGCAGGRGVLSAIPKAGNAAKTPSPALPRVDSRPKTCPVGLYLEWAAQDSNL